MKCFFQEDKIRFVTNFCKKIIKDEKQAILIFKTQEEMDFFDEEIWKYEFIPHCKIGDKNQIHAPILLSIDTNIDNLPQSQNVVYIYTPTSPPVHESNNVAILLENKDFKYKEVDINVEYFIFNEKSWTKI